MHALKSFLSFILLLLLVSTSSANQCVEVNMTPQGAVARLESTGNLPGQSYYHEHTYEIVTETREKVVTNWVSTFNGITSIFKSIYEANRYLSDGYWYITSQTNTTEFPDNPELNTNTQENYPDPGYKFPKVFCVGASWEYPDNDFNLVSTVIAVNESVSTPSGTYNTVKYKQVVRDDEAGFSSESFFWLSIDHGIWVKDESTIEGQTSGSILTSLSLGDGTQTTNNNNSTGTDIELIVEDDKGSAIIATSVSIDTTHTSVPEANTVVTGGNDEITLTDDDNTKVTIKPNTLVTQHPKTVEDDKASKKTTLLRGDLELNVPVSNREYQVVTPVANIIINASSGTSRNTNNAQFSVQYSQDGFNGEMKISVTSGTVVVQGRDGSSKTLTAGQEHTIKGSVNRSNWVLPIDGDYIYGGRENTLCWLNYPGAAGYILEYNFPKPNFTEENPKAPEYFNKSIYFYPSQYNVWQDLVIVPLIIPDLAGQVVEARVFPINAAGQVISTSFGSDKGTYTFK